MNSLLLYLNNFEKNEAWEERLCCCEAGAEACAEVVSVAARATSCRQRSIRWDLDGFMLDVYHAVQRRSR